MHVPSRPGVGPRDAERTPHNACQSGAKMDIAAELDLDLDLHSQNTRCRHLIKRLPAAQGFPSFHGVALLQAMATLVSPDPASNVRQCHLCMGVAKTELRIGAYSDKTPKNCHQRDRNRSLALLQTFRSASS